MPLFLPVEASLSQLKAKRVANLVKIDVLKMAWEKASTITSCRQPV